MGRLVLRRPATCRGVQFPLATFMIPGTQRVTLFRAMQTSSTLSLDHGLPL